MAADLTYHSGKPDFNYDNRGGYCVVPFRDYFLPKRAYMRRGDNLVKFIRDKSGTSTAEMSLILAVTVVIAVSAAIGVSHNYCP